MDAGFIIACPDDEEVCTIAECIRLRWGAPRGARYRTPEYNTFLYSSSATMAVITSNGMLIRFLTSFARVSCSRFAPLRHSRSLTAPAAGLRRNPMAGFCRSSSTRHSLLYSWGSSWGSRPCVSGARPGVSRASPATSFECVSEAALGSHLAALPGQLHHIFSDLPLLIKSPTCRPLWRSSADSLARGPAWGLGPRSPPPVRRLPAPGA